MGLVLSNFCMKIYGYVWKMMKLIRFGVLEWLWYNFQHKFDKLYMLIA